MPSYSFLQFRTLTTNATFWIAVSFGFLFLLVERWKLLDKMCMEGWKSLIPIYGELLAWQHTWNGGFYFLHLLFSVAGTVMLNAWNGNLVLLWCSIVCFSCALVIYARKCYHTSRAFGHGGVFAVGMLLFPGFFDGVLAFSFDPYLGNCS